MLCSIDDGSCMLRTPLGFIRGATEASGKFWRSSLLFLLPITADEEPFISLPSLKAPVLNPSPSLFSLPRAGPQSFPAPFSFVLRQTPLLSHDPYRGPACIPQHALPADPDCRARSERRLFLGGLRELLVRGTHTRTAKVRCRKANTLRTTVRVPFFLVFFSSSTLVLRTFTV